MLWFENEYWYTEQTPRWNVLEAAGWQFSKPPPVFNRVGLRMQKSDDSYTFYVAKDQDPRCIHTQLLERAEYHANYFQSLAGV